MSNDSLTNVQNNAKILQSEVIRVKNKSLSSNHAASDRLSRDKVTKKNSNIVDVLFNPNNHIN
jgi:hypothetical protein